MGKKIAKTVAAIAALAALALGGSALANANNGNQTTPAQATSHETEQGSESANDADGSAAAEGSETGGQANDPADGNEQGQANDKADSGKHGEANDKADGNDGGGGHEGTND